MKDKKRPLYLYEALELRSEYDARIKTLKDCLPESKQNRDRFSFTQELILEGLTTHRPEKRYTLEQKTMQQVEQKSIIAVWLRVSIFKSSL